MKKKLGQNPLSPSESGIFTKTQDSSIKTQDSRNYPTPANLGDSSIKTQDSRFLNRDQATLKGCNVRLPESLIDWLDELVKNSSRDRSRSRIAKEVWVQAALEYFQSLPIDWNSIKDEDDLRTVLESLHRGEDS